MPSKVTYQEKYKPGSRMIKATLLPERLPYMMEDYRVDAIELLSAGLLDDGREFQDVRIYTREVVTDSRRDDGESPLVEPSDLP